MNELTRPETAEPVARDAMTAVIERIAMDPSIPIDRLERMLEMQRSIAAEQQRRAYFAAMASCQEAMEPVARNKANDHTKSKYADLSAIYSACKPIISEHGLSFSTSPITTETKGVLAIHWELRHRDGHSESGDAEFPLDGAGMKGASNKTDIQAIGSTASYARRYLFCMLFDIAVGDDNDGNARQAVTTISAPQFVQLRDALEASGADPVKFHTAFGHRDPANAHLEEFPASRFDEAMQMLRKRAEARANG